MSELDPRIDFESGDAFLHAVLGIAALARRVELPVAAEETSTVRDDDLLAALLGAARLTAQLLTAVERFEVAAPERTPPLSGAETIRGILR